MISLISALVVVAGFLELRTSKLAKINADLWGLSDTSRRASIALDKAISVALIAVGLWLFISGFR